MISTDTKSGELFPRNYFVELVAPWRLEGNSPPERTNVAPGFPNRNYQSLNQIVWAKDSNYLQFPPGQALRISLPCIIDLH